MRIKKIGFNFIFSFKKITKHIITNTPLPIQVKGILKNWYESKNIKKIEK